MDHTMYGSVDYPDQKTKHLAVFKPGDIITVHLDMDALNIGFSLNDKYLGIAFDNIEKEEYRLAISSYSKVERKYEFIE